MSDSQTRMDYVYEPCPFCGNKKIRHDKCTGRIRCGVCYASGPLIGKFMVEGVSEEQAAVNSWNRRVLTYANNVRTGKEGDS